MQVHTLVPHHIVPLARVSEEVGLGACLDTLLDEHEAVLRHYGGVIVTSDHL